MDQDEQWKLEDRERKKAEVRRRLEEQAKAMKGKKGFMTPERKKKLRALLRKKATEELKREQERRAEERKRIIRERTGQPKHGDDGNEASYIKICQEYYERIKRLEDVKYDLEYEVKQKDVLVSVSELSIQIKYSDVDVYD
ncbi:troponin I protein-like protein [Dinothrombium tinctorium]|uniref:Troponin I protein-like protein n=1 Tax=Dinothrombium tinctorium TaxID=1965070 RepID=A0A3S3Q8H0_9ACAR|nr:troponin I protein-like protein [Dinothrombium tinctorium]